MAQSGQLGLTLRQLNFLWPCPLSFATVPPLIGPIAWPRTALGETLQRQFQSPCSDHSHFEGFTDVKSRLCELTARVVLALPALAMCTALSGCADGPVPEMRSLNPWVREQWEEDEKHGPTFYSRLERLGELRSQAGSLSEAERQRVGGELAAILGDERSSPMRVEILRTLSAFPSSEAMPALQAALTDADPQVRIAACTTLGAWKSPEALQALGSTVGSDGDLDVRMAAARALENFNDPAAAQALSVALDDNDPALQKVAMRSLRQSTGKNYGESVVAWREYLAGGNPAPPPAPSIASQIGDWLWW